MWSTTTPPSTGEVVGSMIAMLRHRGPDSNGVWCSDAGHLALGHARLAIVDLSDQGRQPMVSRSGRFVVVFNGEIYNHMALRVEMGAGAIWRGHSDTETLLGGIEHWGLTGMLERAVGMFAFGLWDCVKGELTLARDRMGEKPLYYAHGRNGFAFASELKALRCCPGIDLSLDPTALSGFVRFGYIGGSASAFVGVRKLPPASILVLRSADVKPPTPRRYWSPPAPTAPGHASEPNGASDERRVSELERLLEASVRGQMLADVPLGAFLSGGIDSSLIVAMMQRHSAGPVRTFTMGYDGSDDDELVAARRTASLLRTDHTELRVTPKDVLETIPKLSTIYDEPFADASQVPTVLLSRLTRAHVTVALSGDAGDELFGGYNRYLAAAQIESMLKKWPIAVRRAVGRALLAVPSAAVDSLALALRGIGLRTLPPALGEKLARMAQLLSAPGCREAYLGALSQWSANELDPLLQPAPAPQLDDNPGEPWPQQMMRWDMQTYLPDDILVKVDRAAMASSLETRVPFLDHRIIDFAVATPLHQKIRDGSSKWLLRRLLDRYMPVAMFDRPKQGFTVPLHEWLRGPLRDWAEGLLAPAFLRRSGLLNAEAIRQTWEEHLSGRRNHVRAIWTILMLQGWLAERGAAPAAKHSAAHQRRRDAVSAN